MYFFPLKFMRKKLKNSVQVTQGKKKEKKKALHDIFISKHYLISYSWEMVK